MTQRHRVLVVIAHDLYVRSFVQTGAFDALQDVAEVAFVASDGVTRLDEVQALPGFHAVVRDPDSRQNAYAWVRGIQMVAYRFRSRTMAIKTSQLPWRARMKLKFYALPPLRRRLVRRNLQALGSSEFVDQVLDEVKPDLVIAPTAGTDALVLDMIRSARARNIDTLVLINGWDNLASKATFPVAPAHVGVWGEQSVGHARKIHRLPPDRVHPIGVPTFEGHLRFDPTAVRPFPFRYALFCGSALPFDEMTALRTLEETIADSGVDMRVVYRPHPWRQERGGVDVFSPDEFEFVILDDQMREAYARSATSAETLGPSDVLPELGYYPGLIGHSEFVISPLSTMILEAALLDRPSLAIAYDDHVHAVPPSLVSRFDHFDGIESIQGIELCRRMEDLPGLFLAMLDREYPPLREQIRPWLVTGEGSYEERLAALVRDLLRRASH